MFELSIIRDNNYYIVLKDAEGMQSVLSFINNAELSELQGVPGCSQKKADILAEKRPFADFEEFVSFCIFTICFLSALVT